MRKNLRMIEYKCIDSTNSWLREHIALYQLPLLVTAQKQSEGRGRLGRVWLSPLGGLYMSLGLALEDKACQIATYPQLMAFAIAQLLVHKNVKVKWPNDLIFKDKKVGGLLSETIWIGEKRALIIGVGINVNINPIDLDKVDGVSLDLKMAPKELAEKIVESFLICLDRAKVDGFTHFSTEFEKRLIHKKGENITISQGRKKVFGEYMGLDPSGRLILKNREGDINAISFGEVVDEGQRSNT